MLRTLRAKLILSFSAIAVLSLLLALSVTLLLARDWAEQAGFRTLNQKKNLLFPYLQLLSEQRRILPRELLAARPSIRNAGLRILLVDTATMTIQFDSSAQYDEVGQRFPLNNSDPNLKSRLTGDGVQSRYKFPGENVTYQFVAQSLRSAAQGPAKAGGANGSGTADQASPARIVVLEQPVPDFSQLVGELSQNVLRAVALALVVSLFVGYLLARSISRPIARLAGATSAMSHGDYSQRVPVAGHDELATLTAQFNEMASELGRANQVQRDFIANVSHDLKTPLTSIQGFSQAIIDGAVTQEEGYKQAATIINSEAQRMSRLVNELVSLSALQKGLGALEMQAVDLGSVLTEVAITMQPQALEAGVELATRLEAPGTLVLADVDRLKQAFSNLVDNALKHTPPGGRVRLELAEAPGTVEVRVSDTGQGIPAEDLSRVTERFYQVDKARSSSGHSSSIGLGLAIAQEILLAHRGTLTIESTPGVGTTACIRLPALRGAGSGGQEGVLKRLGTVGRARDGRSATNKLGAGVVTDTGPLYSDMARSGPEAPSNGRTGQGH